MITYAHFAKNMELGRIPLKCYIAPIADKPSQYFVWHIIGDLGFETATTGPPSTHQHWRGDSGDGAELQVVGSAHQPGPVLGH